MQVKRQWRSAAIVAAMVCILNFSTLPAQSSPSFAGANLAWIAYGHTFDADGLHGYASSYNSATVQSAFDDMKSKHLNICRVFLFDDLEGVISNGNLNTIITPGSTYVNNLTDFVTRANNDGITVYATLFNAWDFVTWPSTFKINPTTIFNNSALYSSTGPIQTISRALAGKNVIWDFMNEGNNLAQYYSGGWVDLAGWVNMNSWIRQTKAALRSGGSAGNFTISINDPNVLLFQSGTSDSSDLINRSNLDFYDCHFYNDSGSIAISTASENDGKPCFVGEFGPSSQNWSSTGDNVVNLVDSFWNTATSNGINGILIWAYLDDGSGNKTQGTSELTELGNKAAAAGIGGTGTSVPSAPTNFAATAGNAQVTLSWTASSGATSYNVYRSTTSGGEGSTPITTGLTGTSYTNTGLPNGTKYYYKEAAVNSAGTSSQSTEASATPAATVTVPSAPSGLAATAGNAQVLLTWSASTGATSYNVYRSTTSGGEGSTAIATGITSTSYTNTGLTNGTKYYYKVAAVNSAGTSSQSTEASATPTAATISTTIYDFENSTNGWVGSNLLGGPWSVTEWAASGSYSLKADVTLSNGGQYMLSNQQGNNFSGKTKVTAVVRHATWGTYTGGMTAKVFVQVGSGWTWYDSGAVAIGSATSGTTISLHLTSILN